MDGNTVKEWKDVSRGRAVGIDEAESRGRKPAASIWSLQSNCSC